MQISKRVVHLTLPDQCEVIYSPDGSSRPFVLSGFALSVFRAIESGADLGNFDQQKLGVVTKHLQNEGVISSKTSKNVELPILSTKVDSNKKIAFWIHTNDMCNLVCSYCYVTKGKRRLDRKTGMGFVDFLVSICKQDRISQVTLKFAGGEPLIELALIIDMIAYARRNIEPLGTKIHPVIISNGTLITQDVANIIKANDIRIAISLDGIGKYNSARRYKDGDSSYRDVVKGIDRLLSVGVKPGIICVISNANIAGIPLLIKFASSRKLPISLSLSREYDPEKGLALDLNLVNTKLLSTLEWLVGLPDDDLPRFSFNGVSFKGKRTRVCGAGNTYFSIGPKGNIGSCQMTVDDPFIDSYRNVSSISELSSLCPFENIPSKCQRCVWKYACMGGCEVLRRRTLSTSRTPIFCKSMKKMLPFLLLLEGRAIQRKKKGVL